LASALLRAQEGGGVGAICWQAVGKAFGSVIPLWRFFTAAKKGCWRLVKIWQARREGGGNPCPRAVMALRRRYERGGERLQRRPWFRRIRSRLRQAGGGGCENGVI